MTPLEALRKYWGYPTFREHQGDVIEAALAGRDTLVVMPTGGGKSLCYQIPPVVSGHLTVVASPLLSLMRDQVQALLANGVEAAAMNSALSAEESELLWERLRRSEIRLLYVSPERLASEPTQRRLRELGVGLFAVDEAHCVSQWGPDFRPDYAVLGDVRTALGDPPTLALTATADAATRSDIVARLHLRDPLVVVAGFNRPNIRYTVLPREGENSNRQVCDLIADRPGEAGIVYGFSRKKVEAVTKALCDRGVRAAAYHAGLPMAERERVQNGFLEGDVRVVCATVAFGMGIDKPDVRFVIHRDLPKSVEAYYQETGRGGRDGAPTEATLLFSASDLISVKRLLQQVSDPTVRQIEEAKLEAMAAIAAGRTCRRLALRAYFGETAPEQCGNCDVCLDPPERFDATELVVDSLMTIYRTGQRFGLGRIVDLLRGQPVSDVPESGKYANRAADELLYLLRQLVLNGTVAVDLTQAGAIKLTAKSRPILREGERVLLDAFRPPLKKTGRRRRVQENANGTGGLFEHLRAVRARLAKEAELPPYTIFHDTALNEMVARRPQTLSEFATIPGVGERKLAKYGALFIAAIAEYPPE